MTIGMRPGRPTPPPLTPVVDAPSGHRPTTSQTRVDVDSESGDRRPPVMPSRTTPAGGWDGTDWSVWPETWVLIGCSDSKRDTLRTGAVPARELYTGGLFVEARKWAESWDLDWAVCSALHGVVMPDEKIDSYNIKLKVGQEDWLAEQLAEFFAKESVTSVVVLAGSLYVETALEAAVGTVQVWAPLQELPRKGYGFYKQWLRTNRNPTPPTGPGGIHASPAPPHPTVRS